jgi:hypothetical protein
MLVWSSASSAGYIHRTPSKTFISRLEKEICSALYKEMEAMTLPVFKGNELG